VTRARAAAGQVQVNRRLVRERDQKRTRELLRFLGTAAVLAVPVLGYVWQRVDFLRVSYHYEALQKQRQQAQQEVERLQLERATLMDHDRVERLARQRLGLVDPPADDVRRVRLFDGRIGAVERSVEAGALELPAPQVTIAPSAGAAGAAGTIGAAGAAPTGGAASAAAAPPAAPAGKAASGAAPGRRPSAPVRPHRMAVKR
jgi:cell division protein FtsL